MEMFDQAVIELWRCLNKQQTRYIVVGGIATNIHGFIRFTSDVDLWLDDTLVNRKNFRRAYAEYGMGDYESIETIQFVPGWVDFPLQNGMRLDIQTKLKGVDNSFSECLQMAPLITIENVTIPFLHLNQLLANKKAVGRPKDLLDVTSLEKIKKLIDDAGAD